MALANCRRCGGLYNKVSIDICPACTKEEERLLRETQQYLREHKLATVAQVVEDLDIRCEAWWTNGVRKSESILFMRKISLLFGVASIVAEKLPPVRDLLVNLSNQTLRFG